MIEPSKRSELVSYPIRDIVQAAKKIEAQGTDMIYLNIGDPAPFGFRPPKHILDAVKEALDQNYSGYAPSEGDPELRKTVAEYEHVSPDDVFITAGLSEGIDFVFQAMLDPGRNILLPTPTYPLYLTKERISYGTIEFYGCDENFEPDLDSMRKRINEFTTAITVINPNNPTGAVYSRKTLQGIIDLAGEYKLPIIADDVYDQMVFDGEMTPLRRFSKDVPVVSGNSMSKNYLYPGARVAYLSFQGEGWDDIKETIQRLCNQRLSVNWEMQRAYISAIKGPHNHIKEFNSELKKRRDILVKRCNEIDGLTLAAPKGAFYAFVKVDGPWKNDTEFVHGLLKEGVVTVPGSGFAPTLNEKYFRLVFLPQPEQLEEAFNRIERYMKKI
ncbi:aminotransferase class I/II-fold pyridoxal phosphate-dependent enzyme [Candidatus Micrarchaeota archaeon]|nr:aminotransferase class I/II-fold pyridoxal phosphate-dependent enzyme [Candidatus Micrarchaeota archaeon]MBU1166199.1 aminotransferase class I/II-fold pyridoxal phosphate-dependent enzyme [Candidatus Micrarchaeota archaeon]MBU1887130.1 aminotransferase class I/II-fold pyridoxal phosphate-dependent enzyme [Candidatus Micrarchaeota archaeon]